LATTIETFSPTLGEHVEEVITYTVTVPATLTVYTVTVIVTESHVTYVPTLHTYATVYESHTEIVDELPTTYVLPYTPITVI